MIFFCAFFTMPHLLLFRYSHFKPYTHSPVYQMEFTMLFVFLFAWAFLPLLATRHYQSLWYLGLAGLMLLYLISVITPTAWIFLSAISSDFWLFPALFLFRYTRLVVNLIAFCLYKPAAVLHRPTLRSSDVSVIIPTVEGEGEDFLECIRSVYVNKPGKIIIVTTGPDGYKRALKNCRCIWENRHQALQRTKQAKANLRWPKGGMKRKRGEDCNKRRDAMKPLISTSST